VSEQDWRDANFAANMVRLRTEAGLSQADFVQKLRTADLGVRWSDVHQTTISRIEKGERQVRFSEAYYIASALGTTPGAMLVPPQKADIKQEMAKLIAEVAESYSVAAAGAYRLVKARRRLRSVIEDARAIAERDDDGRLRGEVEHAEVYLGLRLDKAIAAAREASNDPRVTGTSDFIKFYAVTPHAYYPEFVDQGDIDAPDA
jgi:transcriptional regulator with XRE-family HTH domain